jgi:flagellar motor switch protein FliM
MADSPLLTPEELSALAEGVSSGKIEVDTGYNLDVDIRKHDLASEDTSLGVNLTSLDMINERFIRLFRLGMLEVLRTSPRINPSRVEIMRFGDYLQGLRSPLSVNILRMNPLRGYSMVVIEPTVVFSSLDSFFGGFGRGVGPLPSGRLFTPTETRIIKLILQVFFRSMREAWAPITAIELEHVSSEINPQFAQIADENDQVVVSRFEADVAANAGQGFIDMVVPYVALKPVRDLLRSRVQTGDGNEESDKAWRSQLAAAVDDASLDLRVVLGKAQLSLQQLQTFKEGEILYFKKFDLARIVIEETPAFEVEVGSQSGQVAVKVIHSIQPVAPTH